MKLIVSFCHGAPEDKTVNAHCIPTITMYDDAYAYVAISINDLVIRSQCTDHIPIYGFDHSPDKKEPL
jgi:hypothetical protein